MNLLRTNGCQKTRRGSLSRVVGTILLWSLDLSAQDAPLEPLGSFPIPAFPDPDVNVNGLAHAGGQLFLLNVFYNPALVSYEAKVYVLDPRNGEILGSFPAPSGSGLASDGVDLFVNSTRPREGDIIRLDRASGAVLEVISPLGVTITGGARGLAFLEGDLFQVAATTDCGGVSVIRIDPASGTALACFNVDDLGISGRELDSDGTNLLYGTQDEEGGFEHRAGGFRVFTLTPDGRVLGSVVLSSVSEDVNGMACGENRLFVADRSSNEIVTFPCPVPPAAALETFVRGDSNLDGQINLSDGILIASSLFLGADPGCRDAMDADDSGTLELTDAIRVLVFCFQGGRPPAPPHPAPGLDPTPDLLDCVR